VNGVLQGTAFDTTCHLQGRPQAPAGRGVGGGFYDSCRVRALRSSTAASGASGTSGASTLRCLGPDR